MHTIHKRFFFDNSQALEVCWLHVISVRKMMCTGRANALRSAIRRGLACTVVGPQIAGQTDERGEGAWHASKLRPDDRQEGLHDLLIAVPPLALWRCKGSPSPCVFSLDVTGSRRRCQSVFPAHRLSPQLPVLPAFAPPAVRPVQFQGLDTGQAAR